MYISLLGKILLNSYSIAQLWILVVSRTDRIIGVMNSGMKLCILPLQAMFPMNSDGVNNASCEYNSTQIHKCQLVSMNKH